MYGQRLEVDQLVLIETGTFNDQFVRPYQSDLNYGTVEQLRYATNQGKNVAPAALGSVSGQIIRPMAQAVHGVNITHGFGERRFRWMLRGTLKQMGGSIRVVLLGYTDYVGANFHSGAIDPNMRFHVNSTMTLNEVVTHGPNGRVVQTRVVDSSHVLTSHQGTPMSGEVSLRPQDVVHAIQSAGYFGNGMGEDVVDTRTGFQLGGKLSRRSNTSSANYLSRMLDATKRGKETANVMDYDQADELDNVAGILQERDINSDAFLGDQNFSTLRYDGTFTYHELSMSNPGLDDRTVISRAGTANAHQMRPVAQRGTDELWTAATAETVVATTLAQAVPGIMVDSLVTALTFSATNNTHGGHDHVAIQGFRTFMGNVSADVEIRHVEAAKSRIMAEILPGISHNGMQSYEVQATIDLLGETFLSISLGGQPAVPYSVPSFCDALMAPVYSPDAKNLHVLASDIHSIADNLDQMHTGTGII